MQIPLKHQSIKNSLLEFIPPPNFSIIDDGESSTFKDSITQVTFSFLVVPSGKVSLENYNEATFNAQGFEILMKYQINCEVEATKLYLVKNCFMPGHPSKELIAIFHDGENLIMLNCFSRNEESFELVIEDFIKSLSSIRIKHKEINDD